MLKLPVRGIEFFDERTCEFIYTKSTVLQLEHSLISLSKWESKWHKPFLSKENKTDEEIRDYVRCMTITQNVDPLVYKTLTRHDIELVEEYMSDPMTATTIKKNFQKSKQRNITSELIYYWMVSFQIPFECEKWHLNRLLTLIDICGIENSPKKRMKKGDIYRQNSQLNAARRKAMGSKG